MYFSAIIDAENPMLVWDILYRNPHGFIRFFLHGRVIETFPIIRYNQTWLLQTDDIPKSSAAFL